MHRNIQQYYSVFDKITLSDQKHESIAKIKTKHIIDMFSTINITPKDILCVGFSLVPYGLALAGYNVSVADCDGYYDTFLKTIDSDLKIQEVKLCDVDKKYDAVLALDQYLTHFSAEEQLIVLKRFSEISHTFVTTLRDFKNIKSYERNIDSPLIIRSQGIDSIFLEHREWNYSTKQDWENIMYVIQGTTLTTVGPSKRRTMYFKQMAKFLTDYGAREYTVHKTNMYKPLFSKNYEYVITAKF